MFKSKLFSTGIILLLAITISHAAYIDGLWEVNQSNDLVEIRTTEYGIKAKFVNSSDWDHYDRIKNDIYEDRKGNRYYVKTNDRISWESRDGRRVINLEKSRRQNRSRDQYDQYDYSDYNYGNRGNDRYEQHICSSNCSANCVYRDNRNRRGRDRAYRTGYVEDGISGRYTNRWKNLVAYVEFDGYNVRMKTNQSRKWTTYKRTSRKKLRFVDRWGNEIRIRNNGRLEWRRADNRRKIDFRREY